MPIEFTDRTIGGVWKLIRKYHNHLGYPRIPQTSVVSPIFPGQFNYCLDERHFLEKYGNFIDITEDENFQKMMPVVRLADFDGNYSESQKWKSLYHLTTFTMTTIGGGHVLPSEQAVGYYHKSVETIVDFLTNWVGLDPKRLFVSYFDGKASLKEIEKSKKTADQELRMESDDVPYAHDLAVELFVKQGIPKENLQPNPTRDCFLITNWDITHVPMGYRNEIHYRLDDGNLLDIATVEWLIYEPNVEVREGIKYVKGLKPWHHFFCINGLGIERLLVARKGSGTIWDLNEFKDMLKCGLEVAEIEAVRVLHRVYSEVKHEDLSSSRREKLNHLLGIVRPCSLDKILLCLEANALAYKKIFPELGQSIDYTMLRIISSRRTVY